MKLISLVLIVLALIWSWSITYSIPKNDSNLHSFLQSEIKNRIVDSILKKYPNAQNIRFERLWTKPKDDQHITASFRYSFDQVDEDSQDVSTKTLSGEISLSSQQDQPNEWHMSIQMTRDSLEFQEPDIIRPSATE